MTAAAAHQFRKELGEVFRRALKGLREALARLAIELLHGLREVVRRLLQIRALGAQARGALLKLSDFAVGGQIDFADPLGAGAQLTQPLLLAMRVAVCQARPQFVDDGGESGRKFLAEAALKLSGQGSRMFAIELALDQLRRERVRAFFSKRQLRPCGREAGLAIALPLGQLLKCSGELNPPRRGARILLGEHRELAFELRAFGADPLKLLAIAPNLALESRRRTLPMA